MSRKQSRYLFQKATPPSKRSPPLRTSTVVEELIRRGLQLHAEGNLTAAEKTFREILAREPGHAPSAHYLGYIFYQQGLIDRALEMLAHSIVLDSSNAAFYSNFGMVLIDKGMLVEAAAACRRAIELQPGLRDAHYNLGNALLGQGKRDEAAQQYRNALELDPRYAEARLNLANILEDQGKPDEAIAQYQSALEDKPSFPEAYINWANALVHQNRLEDALPLYERGITLWQQQPARRGEPQFVSAQLYFAMAQLLHGDFAAGLARHEWRHKDQKIAAGYSRLPEPLWQGEPLRGARIALHAEQGLGDTLQFLRYVPLVQQAGGRVMLVVQPCLRRLAEQIQEVTVFCHGEAMQPFDMHCPLMSLPYGFGTTLESIPAHTPYLSVPYEERQRAAARAWPAPGLRVGLGWAGNPEHIRDRHRSLTFSQLGSLLAIEGVHFFSLQLGPAAGQRADNVADLQLDASNMADTAAKVAQLDLVISVDTAVAHLAGALGIPTWLMLAFAPDWRWLLARKDSPWYPTMRLFRQPKLGDWNSVLEEVSQALVELRDDRPECAQAVD